MATTIQDVPPVARGYAYAFRVQVTAGEPPFADGARYRAELRDYDGATALAGEMTTENGGLRRIDASTMEVQLTGAATAKLSNNTASLDIVRADVTPEFYLNIGVVLPVVKPTTRPKVTA